MKLRQLISNELLKKIFLRRFFTKYNVEKCLLLLFVILHNDKKQKGSLYEIT